MLTTALEKKSRAYHSRLARKAEGEDPERTQEMVEEEAYLWWKYEQMYHKYGVSDSEDIPEDRLFTILGEIQENLSGAISRACSYLTTAKPLDQATTHMHRRLISIHYEWKELYEQGYDAVDWARKSRCTISQGRG